MVNEMTNFSETDGSSIQNKNFDKIFFTFFNATVIFVNSSNCLGLNF